MSISENEERMKFVRNAMMSASIDPNWGTLEECSVDAENSLKRVLVFYDCFKKWKDSLPKEKIGYDK